MNIFLIAAGAVLLIVIISFMQKKRNAGKMLDLYTDVMAQLSSEERKFLRSLEMGDPERLFDYVRSFRASMRGKFPDPVLAGALLVRASLLTVRRSWEEGSPDLDRFLAENCPVPLTKLGLQRLTEWGVDISNVLVVREHRRINAGYQRDDYRF